MKKDSSILLAVAIAASIVGGCSTAPTVTHNGPNLIVWGEKQKQMLEARGSVLTGLANTSNKGVTDGVLGSDTYAHVLAWNDGQSFTGLKVILRGNAFSQGYFAAPKGVTVDASLANDSQKRIAQGNFTSTGPGEYTAVLPTLRCDACVDVEAYMTPLRSGKSDFQVIIAPADVAAKPLEFAIASSINAAEPPTASSEAGAAAENDNDDKASATDEKDAEDTASTSTSSGADDAPEVTSEAPKTQLELGQQQAKEQAENNDSE